MYTYGNQSVKRQTQRTKSKEKYEKKFHLQRNLKKFSSNFSVDTLALRKQWYIRNADRETEK